MKPKAVTEDRWESRDHYRAQINVDKEVWAYGYGAIVYATNMETAAHVRNEIKQVVEKKVESHVRAIFNCHEMRPKLFKFIDEVPHDKHHKRAMLRYFARLGLERP